MQSNHIRKKALVGSMIYQKLTCKLFTKLANSPTGYFLVNHWSTRAHILLLSFSNSDLSLSIYLSLSYKNSTLNSIQLSKLIIILDNEISWFYRVPITSTLIHTVGWKFHAKNLTVGIRVRWYRWIELRHVGCLTPNSLEIEGKKIKSNNIAPY